MLIDEANTIQSVPEPIDDPGFGQLFVLLSLLVGRTNGCAKEDVFAIWRPDRGRSPVLHESELACLTAISWNKPDLRFFLARLLLIFAIFTRGFALSIRNKGEPASVR